ncbi:MAG: lantibiotic dehydratase, partial [Chitinophagaceae bacterium]|nr:lantibiotic dehydratase [Chitinophagaceae bacterium]
MNAKFFHEQFTSDFFVVRTPLLPYSHLPTLFDNMRREGFSLVAYLCKAIETDPLVGEALYIASADLHRQVCRVMAGEKVKPSAVQKLEETLYKYMVRMSSRCTPFGIFAGCTTGFWNNQHEITLKSSSGIKRSMRLDMDYVGELALQLSKEPAVYKVLKYTPNNSIYRVGKKIRYTEYRFSGNNVRTHHLVSIDTNAVLNSVLRKCKGGLCYNDIIQLVMDAGHEREESEAYVEELIQSQVLLSETDPTITGQNFPERMLQLLQEKYHVDLPIINSLAPVLTKIAGIDSSKDHINTYKEIFNELKQHPIRISENRVFQIDCYRPARTCTISNVMRDDILKGIQALHRLNPGYEHTRKIHAFKRAFSERYENRIVPLAEALDTEIGLGYKKASSIADMYKPENPFEFDAYMDYKFQKYKHWLTSGNSTIVITEEDLVQYGKNVTPIAHSFNSTVSIVGTQEDYKILLKTASGPSGANLLGRFANLDPDMEEQLKLLCEQEEQFEPGKLFAEIVHLPQARVGNVLARPVLRKYEIPYLASSTVPADNQIMIDDLYLYIKNKRLVLYSKKHDREVVPRLSSAHNFSKGLPIYNFLCELQFQDIQGSMYWDWGFLRNQAYLPRVEYKNVILSTATWNIGLASIAEVKGKKDWPSMQQAMDKLRNQLKLPATVYLVEGDNHLLLDLDTEFCVRYLIKEITQHRHVRLIENLWTTNPLFVRDDTGGYYANEVSIPFIRKKTEPVAEPKGEKVHITNKIKRQFIPGSEWLYFKLYISHESSNALLTNAVYPLMKKLQQEGLIRQWFFIRYGDPRHHIRLRMRLTDYNTMGATMQHIYNKLEDLSSLHIINSIQMDTYIREIERYGAETMELSEQYFFYNSEFVCDLLKVIAQVNHPRITFLAALWGTDTLLDSLGYSPVGKTEVTQRIYDNYERQIQGNKSLKKTISDYYRENSKLAEQLLTGAYDKITDENTLKQFIPE